jgi:hypothetical protein
MQLKETRALDMRSFLFSKDIPFFEEFLPKRGTRLSFTLAESKEKAGM